VGRLLRGYGRRRYFDETNVTNYGFPIIESQWIAEDQILFDGRSLLMHPKMVKVVKFKQEIRDEVLKIFRQGRMLDWYAYVGE
jgi:hypothetical protein